MALAASPSFAASFCPSTAPDVKQLLSNKLQIDGSKLIDQPLAISAGGLQLNIKISADGPNGNMFMTMNILGAIVTAPVEICESAEPGKVAIRVISSRAVQSGKAAFKVIDVKIKSILEKGDIQMSLQSPDGGKTINIQTPFGDSNIPAANK
jgi:hypothetical protein